MSEEMTLRQATKELAAQYYAAMEAYLVREALSLSCGTIATLSGCRLYDEISAIQSAFVAHIQHKYSAARKPSWRNWDDAWRDFWRDDHTDDREQENPDA